jgi:hypothetical protein
VRRVESTTTSKMSLAAYKATRSSTWQPGTPAFLNARGKRWTRNAIAQHVLPPALKEANPPAREGGATGDPRAGRAPRTALHMPAEAGGLPMAVAMGGSSTSGVGAHRRPMRREERLLTARGDAARFVANGRRGPRGARCYESLDH